MNEEMSAKGGSASGGKKAFNIIYGVFIACIVLVAILLIANKFHLPGGIRLYVVESGSMEPKIHTGSLVVDWPAQQYKVGDIITFGQDTKTQTPTTHRIYGIRQTLGQQVYTTKGDANNAPDIGEITGNDIIGKEHLTIPYLGYVLSVAKQPFGFMILIIIPAVIIIYDELRKIVEEFKKIREKKKNEAGKVQN
jgi:signal peptidase I